MVYLALVHQIADGRGATPRPTSFFGRRTAVPPATWVEHWVVAQRQGQIAARDMIGRQKPFDAVPFFWTMHYDIPILYVGHAEEWDALDIDGRIADKNCRVTYRRQGRMLAEATIGRDVENLRAEVELESEIFQESRSNAVR